MQHYMGIASPTTAIFGIIFSLQIRGYYNNRVSEKALNKLKNMRIITLFYNI